MGSLVRAQEGEQKPVIFNRLFNLMNPVVYSLYSKKLNRFYIGSAKDFGSRFEKHKTHYFGKNKFTSKADDWEIFLLIKCDNERQAGKIEAHIKNMKSKTYILNLKKYPEMIQNLLQKYVDC